MRCQDGRRPDGLGPGEIEGGEGGVEMEIEGSLRPSLTIGEAGELFTIPEEKFSQPSTIHL